MGMQSPPRADGVLPPSPQNDPTLNTLPTEILSNIFWKSRELSLINVNRHFRSVLPEFRALARSCGVLAFCSHESSLPLPSSSDRDFDKYIPPITLQYLSQFALPPEAGLPIPLPRDVREELQHDVLTSGWFTLQRFYRLHLHLFKLHLDRLQDRTLDNTLWLSVRNRKNLKFLSQQHLVHYLSSTSKSLDYEGALIVPEVSMPAVQLVVGSRYAVPYRLGTQVIEVEETTLHIDRSQFVFNRPRHMSKVWRILDIISLPPGLLSPPLTPHKRGTLTYLLQEAIPKGPHVGLRPNFRLVNQAIAQAIPLGDEHYLKLLVDLLATASDNDNQLHLDQAGLKGDVGFLTQAILGGHVGVLKILLDGLRYSMSELESCLQGPMKEARKLYSTRTHDELIGKIHSKLVSVRRVAAIEKWECGDDSSGDEDEYV